MRINIIMRDHLMNEKILFFAMMYVWDYLLHPTHLVLIYSQYNNYFLYDYVFK